ncbi:hypothetical protein [Mameliella sp.]|uniref:hypothetical protein n=1 Tax=Mameliella sp. TaxID=1924940 RepID=UPI003BAA5B9F
MNTLGIIPSVSVAALASAAFAYRIYGDRASAQRRQGNRERLRRFILGPDMPSESHDMAAQLIALVEPWAGSRDEAVA